MSRPALRILGKVEPHLREVPRLYVVMGATGHAERLARELGLDG